MERYEQISYISNRGVRRGCNGARRHFPTLHGALMHDRSAWTIGQTGKIKVGNKTYNNLTEFTRPCGKCGKPFSIFVTAKIASGEADTNSFALKNCEEHRRAKAPNGADIEPLRNANDVMKQELDGLYARIQEQNGEITELKKRLAKYELPFAMAEQKRLTYPWEKP